MRLYTHAAGALSLYLLLNIIHPSGDIIIGALLALIGAATPDLLDHLGGSHKGIGHTLLILPPLLVLTVVRSSIGFPVFIGVISHVLMDLFTVHGCPLLYPLRDTPYHCLRKSRRLKTGTRGEEALLIFLIVVSVPLFLASSGELSGVSEAAIQVNHTTEKPVLIHVTINPEVDTNITVKGAPDNSTLVMVDTAEDP